MNSLERLVQAIKKEKRAVKMNPIVYISFNATNGWLNDPNGLCQFKGTYHLYFQYSPENCMGGQKYWGHYSTKDFVTFKNEPVALYPDQSV